MIFKDTGILGINARNLLYIKAYNPKKAIKLADDKIKTKRFLSARGVPVPKLYSTIRSYAELEKFDFNQLPQSFVLKPNNGYGGEGIIPIIQKKGDKYIGVSGTQFTKEFLVDQIKDILDGRYSISGVADTAFFEQYIATNDTLAKYSYSGLPDIRVVVHNLIPVMAMLRLPTKESQGRANLHQGAVGVGIDIAKGQATHICYKNKIIEELPDGIGKIRGFKIPFWDEILMIASNVQLITNLGYMAADICIDKNMGPVLLEINARAGLSVQLANLAPLRRRLERIQGVKVSTPAKGVRIAKDMFGNVIEREIASISGKQVVSFSEEIEIIQKMQNIRARADIDTGRERSVIDDSFALQNNLLDEENAYDDEKQTIKVKFILKGVRKQSIFDVQKFSNGEKKVVLGRRDLKDFLIDASASDPKKKTSPANTISQNSLGNSVSVKTLNNYKEIDEKLASIESRIKLLYFLRPINLEEARNEFFKDTQRSPVFHYPKINLSILDAFDELEKIILIPEDNPLFLIFSKKKEEIKTKLNLIDSIGEGAMSKFSTELYGAPTREDLEVCENILRGRKRPLGNPPEGKTFTSSEAVDIFQKTLKDYGLNKWKVKLKDSMVTDCVAGKNNSLFLKDGLVLNEERVKSLIVHEIETHILTAHNGKEQPYEIFNRGFAGYLKTQEGLAIYNSCTQLNQKFEKNIKVSANLVAIYYALEGSFSETYKRLLSLNLSKDEAFRATLKAKRGLYDTQIAGAFTKDYVYFKGYFEVKDFIDSGGKISDLYIGKINLEDIDLIKKITGIKSPMILPKWA